MRNNPIRAALMLLAAPFILGACQSKQNQNQEDKGTTLQFMTYNVRNGIGMDEVRNLDRVLKVIQQQQPDVIAVQELDSVTKRSERTYPLGILAEKTKMHASYAPAIEFQGGKYGIGMLSKEKPLNMKYYQLPGREEQRALLVVEFEKFVYCCTHISLTPDDQLLSLPIINKVVSEYQKPVLIAGDMNATPADPFILGLQQTFKVVSPLDAKTYPADKPDQTIDYIAVAKKDTARVSVTASEVVNEPLASDHRPIIATVTIK